MPEVAFAWGSKSISKTFFSKIPKHAARFKDVVVLPTPPFWFETAMILPINKILFLKIQYFGVGI